MQFFLQQVDFFAKSWATEGLIFKNAKQQPRRI